MRSLVSCGSANLRERAFLVEAALVAMATRRAIHGDVTVIGGCCVHALCDGWPLCRCAAVLTFDYMLCCADALYAT